MTWTERLVRGSEPANTLSNLAYFAAGFALLLWSPMPRPAAGVAWAALTWLTFGSARFHWFGTSWFRKLDHEGMYVVFGALPVFGWFPHAAWTPAVMALVGIGNAFGWVYLRHRWELDTQVIVLGSFGALPALLFGDRLMAVAGLALIAVARLAWLEDRRPVTPAYHGTRARPLSRLGTYGHAIWHVLTAAGIAALFWAAARP